MDQKPWAGVMPDEDVNAFSGGDQSERAISAGAKPALIVVDMTRAFVDSAYPTGWSPTGYPAMEANRTLLETARAAHMPVYFTKGYPLPGYQPAQRGRWKMGGTRPGLNPDLPPGDVIPESIAPRSGETVIDKGGKPSGFFGTPLASLLVYEGVDTCIVTGMVTSGCVRATVIDAFQYNFHVVVPHEACADRSQLSHKVSLFDMHMKYADVVSLDETIRYIESVAGRVPDAA